MALAPTPQPYRFTVEEYLAFERASDERHEYLDGVIYAMAGSASPQAMAGESEDHGTICMNLSGILFAQLRGTPCRAFSKDTKVRCGPYRSHSRSGLYAYPDLVVVCGPSHTTTRPGCCSIRRSLWKCCHRRRRSSTGATSAPLSPLAPDAHGLCAGRPESTGDGPLPAYHDRTVGAGAPRRPRRPLVPARHRLHSAPD